jgi:hypothetical protein
MSFCRRSGTYVLSSYLPCSSDITDLSQYDQYEPRDTQLSDVLPYRADHLREDRVRVVSAHIVTG